MKTKMVYADDRCFPNNTIHRGTYVLTYMQSSKHVFVRRICESCSTKATTNNHQHNYVTLLRRIAIRDCAQGILVAKHRKESSMS